MQQNLQLYPRNYQSKLVPVIVNSGTTSITTVFNQKLFFENDVEIDESIILGISLETCVFGTLKNATTYLGYDYAYLTLKNADDVAIVDRMPISTLYSPTKPFRIQRFFAHTKLDKCYLEILEAGISIPTNTAFIFTIYFKRLF